VLSEPWHEAHWTRAELPVDKSFISVDNACRVGGISCRMCAFWRSSEHKAEWIVQLSTCARTSSSALSREHATRLLQCNFRMRGKPVELLHRLVHQRLSLLQPTVEERHQRLVVCTRCRCAQQAHKVDTVTHPEQRAAIRALTGQELACS
jgi:hypothetical protein